MKSKTRKEIIKEVVRNAYAIARGQREPPLQVHELKAALERWKRKSGKKRGKIWCPHKTYALRSSKLIPEFLLPTLNF